jgi:sulfoxide reductase heme-binding subunit YedZ
MPRLSIPANSLSDRRILGLKLLIHSLCLYLLVQVYYLGFSDQLGGDPVKAIIHYTGLGALRLLLLTLCITPLSRFTRQSRLLRLRRLLGLYSFVWALAHLGNFVVFDLQLDAGLIIGELTERPYIVVGMLAWLILLALAITSLPRLVRALGRRWKPLHRGIYVAVCAAAIHFLWSVKADITEPLVYLLLTLALLTLRLPALQRRRSARPSV